METPTFAHRRLHGHSFEYSDMVRAVLVATKGNVHPTRILAAYPLLDKMQDVFSHLGHPKSRTFMGVEVRWADIPKDEVWVVTDTHPQAEAMNLILRIDENASHDQFLEGCCD